VGQSSSSDQNILRCTSYGAILIWLTTRAYTVLLCVWVVTSQALNCPWPTHFLVNCRHGIERCVPRWLPAEDWSSDVDRLRWLSAVKQLLQKWKQKFWVLKFAYVKFYNRCWMSFGMWCHLFW
jgi:hypothetical protein